MAHEFLLRNSLSRVIVLLAQDPSHGIALAVPRHTGSAFFLRSSRSGPMWTSWVPTRPSARSCTWVGATPCINTSWGMKELRAALPRRTWGCWWMKSSTWPSNVRSQPRKATVSWATSKDTWPAGRGRLFCSSALERPPQGSPVSSSGSLSTRQTWRCWSASRGRPQRWSEGWSTYWL